MPRLVHVVHTIFTILMTASGQGEHILHVLDVIRIIDEWIAVQNILSDAGVHEVFGHLDTSEVDDSTLRDIERAKLSEVEVKD